MQNSRFLRNFQTGSLKNKRRDRRNLCSIVGTNQLFPGYRGILLNIYQRFTCECLYEDPVGVNSSQSKFFIQGHEVISSHAACHVSGSVAMWQTSVSTVSVPNFYCQEI